MIIKKVSPVSCAKVAGILYGGIGLLAGCIFSVVALFGGLSSATTVLSFDPTPGNIAMAIASPIFFPILYGCLGFILALFGAWLYNRVARLTGGVEIEVE
jgi:hypothetical protein